MLSLVTVSPVITAFHSCCLSHHVAALSEDSGFNSYPSLPEVYLVKIMKPHLKMIPIKDKDEIINHIISDCSKLAERGYKTRQDWVEKVIHWELCKKQKFDETN